jgi:hypothetical protein
MPVSNENPAAGRSRLAALALLQRFHGIGADPEQVRPCFGSRGPVISYLLSPLLRYRHGSLHERYTWVGY